MKTSPLQTQEMILYTTPDGEVKMDILLHNETIWLTQKRMAELFGVDVKTVNEHLRNIYKSSELLKDSTIWNFQVVQKEGKRNVKRTVQFYNLDAILSVGYRVNSRRATHFRIWASRILKEYIIKGFAMDDERLKQENTWNYFDEWLERIRDIRASEKRFYQKIRDIYATAVDYDKTSNQARLFFKKVQNKMLWTVTGHTAAELINERSNPKIENMGLTAWRGTIVRKQDVGIAKNYLQGDEIKDLNEIVTMYLDYAEREARRRQTVSMDKWSDKLDIFLDFNEQEILTHAGKVKAEVAKKIAEERYDEFDILRKKEDVRLADKADIKELVEYSKELKGR